MRAQVDDFSIRAYVTMRDAAAAMAARLGEDRERGLVSIEWLGLVGMIVAFVAVLITAAPQIGEQAKGIIENAITQVGGGGNGGATTTAPAGGN
jgi:hypothetical protein